MTIQRLRFFIDENIAFPLVNESSRAFMVFNMAEYSGLFLVHEGVRPHFFSKLYDMVKLGINKFHNKII